MTQPVIIQWSISSFFGWGVYGLNLALHWAGDPAIDLYVRLCAKLQNAGKIVDFKIMPPNARLADHLNAALEDRPIESCYGLVTDDHWPSWVEARPCCSRECRLAPARVRFSRCARRFGLGRKGPISNPGS